MRLISTAGKTPPTTLAEALFSGLAPDGGLYLPETLRALPAYELEAFREQSLAQIGLAISKHLAQDEISDDVWARLLPDALDFRVPLIEIEPRIFALELFHGPTLAFKDVGARFLARLMSHCLEEPELLPPERRLDEGQQLTVLAATSGDTGSAVAHAFWGVPHIRVIVLYPRGQVSEAQRRLFTTLGGNVAALEIDGSFDDCQRLAKAAFSNEALRAEVPLASANSINIGRLIPQSFYYFHARSQLLRACPDAEGQPLIFSTPSGNFGNLTAGLIARRLGLEVDGFVAATNVNDVVPEYLAGGDYSPRPSQPTLSNAMDVGDPSNFDRILSLYGQDRERLQRVLEGHAFTDAETLEAMRDVHARTGKALDPHSAVGYLGLRQSLASKPDAWGIFLCTAHPAKFAETVERALGEEPRLPSAISAAFERPEQIESLAADEERFFARLRS